MCCVEAALDTAFLWEPSRTKDEHTIAFVGFGVGDVYGGHTPGYVARSSVHGCKMTRVYMCTPADGTVCATGLRVVNSGECMMNRC